MFYHSEELLEHVFEGYLMAFATKSIKETGPKRKQKNSKSISRAEKLDCLDSISREFICSLNCKTDDPKAKCFTNKLMIEILLGFYFKDAIKEEKGWNAIRSYKFLLPRFIGKKSFVTE